MAAPRISSGLIRHLCKRPSTTSTHLLTIAQGSRLKKAVPRQAFLFTTNSTVAGSNAPRQSRWKVVLLSIVLSTSAAVGATLLTIYVKMSQVLVSDEESLRMYKPEDAAAQEIEDYINAHPLVAELRRDPTLTEARPHLKLPAPMRAHSLTGTTLMGPGRMTVPPFDWTDTKEGKSYVQIAHLGEDLCGHPGIVHGGFLATMLDEGLARCCFPVLPHRIGLTASLNLSYRSPCMANNYVVLRAKTTKVEGRKAWVEGRIETLVAPGETPTVLAEANALFISPRSAATFAKFIPQS